MSSASEQIRILRDSAVAAVAAGDYAAAIQHALGAQAAIACLPSMGSLSMNTQWRADDITKFIQNCRAAQAASLGGGSGIQRSKIRRRPVGRE